MSEADEAVRDRPDLRADCANCFGLCCVALGFSASADFAIDKAVGEPCPNLQADFRCGIHSQLRERGFPGCTVYDCQGAGQKISQVTFGGLDWRSQPILAAVMFDAFGVMRNLHALLWYLTEALTMPPAGAVHADLERELDVIERLTRLPHNAFLSLDVEPHRARVAELLLRVSSLVRADVPKITFRGRGADLVGAKLHGADLRGVDLIGALLVGADLSGADLRIADLLGADVRGADVRGADLTGCLFLTQGQLNATNGDAATKLSPSLLRPTHWPV